MLAAGVTTGIMNSTGFGNVAEKAKLGGVAGRNHAIFERVLLRTGVNTAIKGGSLRDNLKDEALCGALAVGQGYIGDYVGAAQGLMRYGGSVLGKTIDYTLNPKLVVNDFKIIKQEASAFGRSIKNFTTNNVKKVQGIINPGKAAAKTGEKITTNIANKSQNYDKNLEHLQQKIGEVQRSLIDNSHFENIGTFNSSPNKPFTGTPANDNSKKASLKLINTPKKEIKKAQNVIDIKPEIPKTNAKVKKSVADQGEKVNNSSIKAEKT